MAKSKTTRVKSKTVDTTIIANKRARHDYYIEDTFEAGVALLGWEVKSLRMKKVQLTDSYVLLKDGEAFLLGCHVTPLNTANTHVIADPDRTKKLLLKDQRTGQANRGRSTEGPHLCRHQDVLEGALVKVQIALAKGKQDHDKRAAKKDQEWAVDKQRIVRHAHR